MNSSPLINIQTIRYSYPIQKEPGTRDVQESRSGQSVLALCDVDLRIWPGEYVVLLGHNGSGKSTLARHCNALLVPDSGHVLVDGLDTSDGASQYTVRDRVGMILQNPDNQIIATIVKDDVAWGLAVRGLPASLIHERVAEALSAVGITHLSMFPPHKLSGGQRQRLAIAGILALRPQCIIADEATSMLDPLSRQEITALLHQLNQRAWIDDYPGNAFFGGGCTGAADRGDGAWTGNS